MFEIKYKIIDSNGEEEIHGLEGFFQIKCNDKVYGEFYPLELEGIMDSVSIYNWFERMLRVEKGLNETPNLFLSDVESFNLWIQFNRIESRLIISLVESDKLSGSTDIEKDIQISYGDWCGEEVEFAQFRREVLEKAGQYINSLKELNQHFSNYELIEKLEKLIEK